MSTQPTRHQVGVGAPLPKRPATGKTPGGAPVATPPRIPGSQAPPPPVDEPVAPVAPVVAPAPDPVDAPESADVHTPVIDSTPAPGPALAADEVIDLDSGEITTLDEEAALLDGSPTPAEEPSPALAPPAAVAPTLVADTPVAAPTPAPVAPARRAVDSPANLVPRLPGAPAVSTSVDTTPAVDEVETWAAVTTPRDPIVYIDDNTVADDDDDGFEEDSDGSGQVREGYRPPKANRAVKVTPRDIRILQFLCRYRFATYPQLMAQFDTSVDVMRRRMPKLQREGLVKSMRFGPTKFLLWRVTEAGTELSGLNLTVPRKIAMTTIRHDLGLVDLGIRFEAAGEVVVTEREIRAADTRNAVSDRMQIARAAGGRTLTDAPVFAVGFGAINGKQRGAMHIPDLVLVREPIDGAPQSIAVELELHHKAPIRVRETLFAYKNATNIGAVVFYTDKVDVRNLINQAANDTGTTNIVTIRKWEPAAESGDLLRTGNE